MVKKYAGWLAILVGEKNHDGTKRFSPSKLGGGDSDKQ